MSYYVDYKIHTQEEFENLTKNLVQCKVGVNKSNGKLMSTEYAIVKLLFKVFDVKEPTFISIIKDKDNQFLTVFAIIALKSSSDYIYSPVMNVQLCNDNVSCTDDPIHFEVHNLSLTLASMKEPKLKDYIKFDGLNITMVDPTPTPPESYTVILRDGGPGSIWKSSEYPDDGDFKGDYVDCLEFLYDNRKDKELFHQYALVIDQSTKFIQILEYSKSIKIDRSRFTIVCIGSIDKINEELKEIISKYTDNTYYVGVRNSTVYQIQLRPNPTTEFSGSLKECNDFIYDKVKYIPSPREFAVYRGQNEFPRIELYDNDDDAEFHGTIQECNKHIANWCKSNINIIKMLAHG